MEFRQPTPRFIGRYEIEGVEAEGGMGVVYVARDPRVKRRVAVKLLKKLFCQDPSVRRRFEREAEAVAGLEHEAIVPVYDFGEHEGMLYIVMRYVGGGTLRDRIATIKRLSLREVAAVIDRVAEALAAAHTRGIIHRDIKPANILFDEREVPYLSDFGVAKAAESNEQISNSEGSMVLGTPQYLSPEQAMGRPVDGRSDVYSLGIVAFHALVGRPPFEAPNPIAMAMAHVNDEPPKISRSRPRAAHRHQRRVRAGARQAARRSLPVAGRLRPRPAGHRLRSLVPGEALQPPGPGQEARHPARARRRARRPTVVFARLVAEPLAGRRPVLPRRSRADRHRRQRSRRRRLIAPSSPPSLDRPSSVPRASIERPSDVADHLAQLAVDP